jgi:hypothetical protein
MLDLYLLNAFWQTPTHRSGRGEADGPAFFSGLPPNNERLSRISGRFDMREVAREPRSGFAGAKRRVIYS